MTNQTSLIAAALIIAFLVFITVRGELPAYIAVFTGTAPAPAGSGSTNTGARNAAFSGTGNDTLGNRPLGAPTGGVNISLGGIDSPSGGLNSQPSQNLLEL